MEKNTKLEQLEDGWVRWPKPEVSEQQWEHKFNEYIYKLGDVKVSIDEYILIRRSFRAGWLSKEQST